MDRGEFHVLEDEGALAGCVYVELRGERSYVGLLSIDPSRQHGGLGSRLLAVAEDRARGEGCAHMDMLIVNLRKELPPYYGRRGYVETGTAPVPESTPTTVNGTLPMRMIAPTGSSSGNRLSTTVWPSTQTLVPAETSSSVNMLPLAISQLLTSRYPVEVPVTLVNQFWLP